MQTRFGWVERNNEKNTWAFTEMMNTSTFGTARVKADTFTTALEVLEVAIDAGRVCWKR